MGEFIERRVLERRTVPPHGRKVYLLYSDLHVLDVYEFPNDAYTMAMRFIDGSGGQWSNSRPGRWWGPNGRLLEIQMRELKVLAGDRRATTT